ncbi:MAG: hypothetical protein OXE46_11450 [Chloroflexi bacterium]|nr:hypothetical protein [Chloroflexota bacterium]
MAYLAMIIPRWRHIRLPMSRDQIFLLLVAFNHIFIAADIYLAHSISGGMKAAEQIPIVFGLGAGSLLLLAGVMANRNRPAATVLANLVFIVTIVIGVSGAYLHLNRTVLLDIGLVSLEAVHILVWSPPVIGPMFFVLIGVLGISAAWIETPPDSGRLQLIGERRVQMPYSKTRAYMLITAIFILATLISSVLDHARFRFDSVWVWLPVAVALFGLTTSLFLGLIKEPNAGDVMAHAVTMLMLIVVGVIGLILHTEASLTTSGQIVVERFLRGSPVLAPLLFCNVGLMGLVTLLDPREG